MLVKDATGSNFLPDDMTPLYEPRLGYHQKWQFPNNHQKISPQHVFRYYAFEFVTTCSEGQWIKGVYC